MSLLLLAWLVVDWKCPAWYPERMFPAGRILACEQKQAITQELFTREEDLLKFIRKELRYETVIGIKRIQSGRFKDVGLKWKPEVQP